jgi:HAE1 family hydrophobic/amphiphilic exporter-1
MSFRISSWAIKSPTVPIVAFVILVLAGLFSYAGMPVTNLPNISIPIITISVTQPGAAPAEVETQITKRIEGAVAGITGVKRITSSVSEGLSSTTMELRLGTDMLQALSDTKDAVTAIRSQLPSGINEPLVAKLDVEGGAILTYAVANPRATSDELAWFVDDTITRSLLGLKGVSQVSRLGGTNKEITVALDFNRMAALKVTASEITQALRTGSIDVPGGRVEQGDASLSLRMLGGAETADELAQMRLPLSGGRTVLLADVATVRIGAGELSSIARFNNQPVVGFSVYRAKGSSEVQTQKLVDAALASLGRAHPDYSYTLVQDRVVTVVRSYHSTLASFIEGTVLAVLIVFLFLRDWRATLVSAVAVPLSVIPTFFVMHYLGFTLNMVSLLALSLVAGVLVDDAIVETENIVRHIRMGKTPYQAALEASDEIGLAVLATSSVIIAVFAPVSFMDGIVGQYFREFGLTVAVSVFFSLVVARLITPVLAAYFLKDAGDKEHGTPGWVVAYGRWLAAALRHRGLTLLGGLVILIGSVALVPMVPTGFISKSNEDTGTLQVKLQSGTTLQDADRRLRAIAEKISKIPEVRSIFLQAGDATLPAGAVTQGSLLLSYGQKSERQVSSSEIEQRVSALIRTEPGVQANFMGGNGRKDVTFSLVGDLDAELEQTARALEKQLAGLPQLSGVTSSRPVPRTELHIRPDTEAMARLGVSTVALADTARIATAGESSNSLPKFNEGSRQIPIRVMVDAQLQKNPDLVRELPVPARDGMVPLKAVADVTLGTGPASISRYDRARQVSFEANLAPGYTLGQAMTAINALQAMTALPASVQRTATGDAEMQAEMFGNFAKALGLGLLLVYAVLVLLFRTPFQPVTIMVALPLSVGGAMLGLLAFQQTLGLSAVIGILMLMGIVGKNSILLVDYVVEIRAHGMDRATAILEAGQNRSRPIVMTTIAMVAGMLPVAMGMGDGAAFRQPMAVTVIGGLLLSTVLSLVFVPVVYTYIDDLQRWLTPHLRKLTTHHPETE